MWNAQNITTIIVAGISAIVSIGTVAYVKIKSNFQDKRICSRGRFKKQKTVNPQA